MAVKQIVWLVKGKINVQPEYSGRLLTTETMYGTPDFHCSRSSATKVAR